MNKEKIKERCIASVLGIKKYKIVLLGLLTITIIAGFVYAALGGIGGGDAKDGVVAKVNGESIFQSEFDQHFNQEMQGIDTSNTDAVSKIRSQIIEELIDNKLLTQAVLDSGIEIDTETVGAEVALMEQQIGGREAFLAKLSEIGVSEDKFKEDITNQFMIQKYLLDNVDIDSVTVTEKEIMSLYNNITANQDNVPPLSEIKQQISSQIIQNKQQELVGSFIQSLRINADIEIL